MEVGRGTALVQAAAAGDVDTLTLLLGVFLAGGRGVGERQVLLGEWAGVRAAS